MSKGQLRLLKQILRAGGTTSEAPLDRLRDDFERFNAKFPPVEGVRTTPVELDRNAGSVRAEWVDARAPDDQGDGHDDDRTILYLHGGGFVIGSIDSHRQLVARLSRAAGARCLSLGYRLAPEHPYPAALDDTLAAYAWLLERHPPERLALAGDSAGAGLAALALTRIAHAERAQPGKSQPSALVCFSPWVDYAGTTPTLDAHAELDPMVGRQGLERMARLYLGDADPWHPEVSPLAADLRSLPPMLIQVGGAETLLDDGRRLADRAVEHGVRVELDTWPDMFHAWHLFAGRLEEGQQAIEAAGAWLRRRWA